MGRNTIFLKVMGIFSVILSLVAVTVSSTACCGWLYQPKVPKCIKK